MTDDVISVPPGLRDEGGRLPPAATPRRLLFASYEIHPTTWGGCGVLLHHAAELLLAAGHEVHFLLDLPRPYFERFRDQDRLALPHPERCHAWHVDELCQDFAWGHGHTQAPFQWKALRFAHAWSRLARRQDFDFVEFFEYCGVGYYALARRLYGLDPEGAVLGVRVHNSIELIDRHEATKPLTLDRHLLYGLERGALGRAEAVLAPTPSYSRAYVEGYYGIDPARIVLSQSPRRAFPRVTREARPTEVVYFGRVFQFKGVDKLVQAALLLLGRGPGRDVKFVFIGMDTKETPRGDSHVAWLKSMVPAALADRFEFTGQLSHEETARRLARCRFAVFTNEFESFCYAAHEVYHAGIPVILNDLPGFRDFFRHEDNALLFDGSVAGLVVAMERLLEEDELARRLCCPYPVATEPLGDWYGEPRCLRAASSCARPGVLTLCLSRGDRAAEASTLEALRALEGNLDQTCLLLREAGPTDQGGVPFLGGLWVAVDAAGDPVPFDRLRTREALWILEAGDRPRPPFLDGAVGALAKDASLGFAGSWIVAGGQLQPALLDIAPEVAPFLYGPAPTRAVLRTEPDQPLVDVFDARHGAYGEIDYLWSAVDRYGPGCLAPEAWLEVPGELVAPADPVRLSFLVATQEDPHRLERLARLATVVRQDPVATSPSRRAVKRLALRTLTAKTLFGLGLRRLGRGLRRRAP